MSWDIDFIDTTIYIVVCTLIHTEVDFLHWVLSFLVDSYINIQLPWRIHYIFVFRWYFLLQWGYIIETQKHQTIKHITQTGFPSPVPLRGRYILCLVCCTGQHCIIKPLLLSWHIALHCFHESFMSTEWCRCQFEGHISTNFGQIADSASMIKNLGDGLKVRGL